MCEFGVTTDEFEIKVAICRIVGVVV